MESLCKSLRKSLLCASILVLCIALAACNRGEGTAKAAGNSRKGGGDVPVTVAKVSQKEVPIDLQVIGNIEAYTTIAVKAQVSGELTKASFGEGDYVKTGELLFTIDPRQIEAQVRQAEAMLGKNRAQLAQAQANLAKDKAQAEYLKAQAARYAKLAQEGVLSKEQNDQAQTAALAQDQTIAADEAAIQSSRADMAAATATIENLRVMQGYTQIRSPIDGRTGNVNFKQGNVVTANSSELMTINKVQPIYATFAVPEAHLPAIKERMQREKVKVFATPQSSNDPPEEGELTFIDNTVDVSTGTIKMKGTFRNADRKLWPGEFVRVTVRLQVLPNAMVVPNQAVQTGQAGPFVWVVKEDRGVEVRPVQTGTRIDQDLVVMSGLQPGETIVVDGQLRLGPQSKVVVSTGRPGGGQGRRKAPQAQ